MTEVFGMNSSLWRHTLYTENGGGSLERTSQTTAGAIIVQTRTRPLTRRFANNLTRNV